MITMTAMTVRANETGPEKSPRKPILGPYHFSYEVVPGIRVFAMMPKGNGLVPTYLGVCAYLVTSKTGRHVLIDSGETDQIETLVGMLAGQNVKPGDIEMVICTHEHGDHAGGAAFFQKHGAKIAMHEAAGESIGGVGAFRPDVRFRDGDIVRAGGMEFRVLHTPGHTPSSCCFALHHRGKDILFAGDLAEWFIVEVGSKKDMLESVRKAGAVHADCVFFGHKIVDEDIPEFWKRFEKSHVTGEFAPVSPGVFSLVDTHDYQSIVTRSGERIIARQLSASPQEEAKKHEN